MNCVHCVRVKTIKPGEIIFPLDFLKVLICFHLALQSIIWKCFNLALYLLAVATPVNLDQKYFIFQENFQKKIVLVLKSSTRALSSDAQTPAVPGSQGFRNTGTI